MESEGHEEKYRAVIDGGYPEDEPVGQRWGKVEPAPAAKAHDAKVCLVSYRHLYLTPLFCSACRQIFPRFSCWMRRPSVPEQHMVERNS